MSRAFDPQSVIVPDDNGEAWVVVAGPGTSLTIPGIIVTEIVSALAATSPVRRIEVDIGINSMMGLHRAPSLAAAHGVAPRFIPQQHQAPRDARARRKALRQWIGLGTKVAVAYAWPGIDNDWIHDFVKVSKKAGVQTIVLCASLPSSRSARAVSLLSVIREADHVVVGDANEANELVAAFGPNGPDVTIHRALSLRGRRRRNGPQQFTAFLSRDGVETFTSLIGAFDAFPDSQANNYSLNVITRYDGNAAKSIIAKSYHARHVQLVGDDVTTDDLHQLCNDSSAVGMADPQLDSRAFSEAVNCGVAAVVLAGSRAAPTVGRGYVGGLMAIGSQPASIHVAMAHALRLDELSFPNPHAWGELADGLLGPLKVGGIPATRTCSYTPALSAEPSSELARFFRPTIEPG